MNSEKIENILNLSLDTPEDERERSEELSTGYNRESKTWELIVLYHGDLVAAASQIPVTSIEILLSGYAIVTIRQDFIDQFSELEEVEYIEKPKRLYFSIEPSPDTSVFSITEIKRITCVTPVNANNITGENVLIGIIDSGIDLTSQLFRNNDGTTRVVAYYDQTTLTEYSESDINTLLASNGDLPRDISGHGSGVAALAAGSNTLREPTSPVTGKVCSGVAPGAGLIAVKLRQTVDYSFPRTTEIMRGMLFCLQKSIELSKPIAMNLSIGNTYGSHDGTSILERYVDTIASIDRNVIVIASGNEGTAQGHTEILFSPNVSSTGNSRTVELSVANYQKSFSVSIYKNYPDVIDLNFILPDRTSEIINLNRPGKQVVSYRETKILIYVGEPSPYSVTQEIFLEFVPNGSYVNEGIYSFMLTPITIRQGKVNLYLSGIETRNTGTFFFASTPYITLTIPSSASRVITVGAYNPTFDAYADFSGRGERLESGFGIQAGIGKPDLVAPGVNIVTINGRNEPIIVSGTSYAAPLVTGAAALLMEWGIVNGNDPYLYGEKVKAYLIRGAKPLRSGGSDGPNSLGGWGALCVNASLPT